MNPTDFDSELRRLFKSAFVDPSAEQVQRVLQSPTSHRPFSTRQNLAVTLLAAVCALAAGIALTPPARATLLDGLGAIGDFIHGGGEAPGPSISDVSYPGWVNALPPGPRNGPAPPEAHVLDTAQDGERFLAYRDATHLASICFLYGSFGGECRAPSDPLIRSLLTEKPLGLLARSQNESGQVGLWGVVGGKTKSVRVVYKSGIERETAAQDGFIVVGPPDDAPVRVAAIDAHGATLATLRVDESPLTECDPSGCGAVIFGQN